MLRFEISKRCEAKNAQQNEQMAGLSRDKGKGKMRGNW